LKEEIEKEKKRELEKKKSRKEIFVISTDGKESYENSKNETDENGDINMTVNNDSNNSNNIEANRSGCGGNHYDEMVVDDMEIIQNNDNDDSNNKKNNTNKIHDLEKEKKNTKDVKKSQKNELIEKLRIKLYQFNMNLNRSCGVVGGRSVTMPEGKVSW
jgi:hypothetical protein